jgi:hypothetical protein
LNQGPPDFLRPLDRFGQAPRRVDDVIGELDFLPGRHLGADLAEGLLLADPVSVHEPAELNLGPAGRDDDRIEVSLESRLDGQGGLGNVDGGAAVPLEGGHDLLFFCQHERMDDGVEGGPGRGVGENDGPQPGAVDRPVEGENGRAEAGHDLGEGRPSRRHELAGDGVGRMNEATEVAQDGSDDGFSAGDSSRKRDGQHGP